MKRMAYVLVVLAIAGLVLVVSGCKEPWESEAEVRQLVEETGSLKAQNRMLGQEQRRLEKEVNNLESENKKLEEQLAIEDDLVAKLKDEVERLKVDGIAAVRAVKRAVAAEAVEEETRRAEALIKPSKDKLRQEREKRIAEVAKEISTLEPSITNLRAQIARVQAEVSSLTRATLDARMIPPPGGYISGGYVYRRRLTCGRREILRSPNSWEVHRHTEYCYTSYRIGPAVKQGDFRTRHDKDMATEAARKKLLPLFEEMRPLDEELAQLKEELGKLRKEKIEEGQRPEEGEAVVVVLKYKETGETIKGTLTKQKINNLTVFKLADGGTKLINPDEWETLEAEGEATQTPAEKKAP